MRVLLALAAALTTFAVAWLTQDWFNTILNKLPLTPGGPARMTDLLVTLAAFPFILLFNMLALPGALVVAVLEPFCGRRRRTAASSGCRRRRLCAASPRPAAPPAWAAATAVTAGHSPRVAAIMEHGRWQSSMMPARYTRHASAAQSALARLYAQGG